MNRTDIFSIIGITYMQIAIFTLDNVRVIKFADIILQCAKHFESLTVFTDRQFNGAYSEVNPFSLEKRQKKISVRKSDWDFLVFY